MKKMVSKIKEEINATDNRVIGYTNLLNNNGIKTRYKNAYIISGKGDLKRLRVKLDRRNLYFLSDKIRDVSYCLGLIKLLKDGYKKEKFNNLTQVYEFIQNKNIVFDHLDNNVENNSYENINPLIVKAHEEKHDRIAINNYWKN